MEKSYVFLGVIALIIIIAAITNPGLPRHKEVVKTELKAYMQTAMKEKMKQTTGGSMMGEALGAMLGGSLIDQMVDGMVSTNNYVLFSTTKVTYEGESHVIGVGAFGNVYITGKLKEAMEKSAE